MKGTILYLVPLFLSVALVGQATNTNAPDATPAQPVVKPSTQEQPADTSNFTSAKGFVLEDSIPVKLRINRTISSADCHVGDTVDFEVVQDVSVNGTLVIPKGGLAFATVTEAQAKRRMARGGKLGVNIDYVKLVSSEKAPLRSQGPQGRRSHGSHGGRHRSDRPCILSGSAIFPVHARQGHHHPERD